MLQDSGRLYINSHRHWTLVSVSISLIFAASLSLQHGFEATVHELKGIRFTPGKLLFPESKWQPLSFWWDLRIWPPLCCLTRANLSSLAFMKEGVFCVCVCVFDLYFFQLWCCSILFCSTGCAPCAPHRFNYVSQGGSITRGKRGNPRGGRVTVMWKEQVKLKRWTVFDGLVFFVFLNGTERLWQSERERESFSLCSVLMVVSGHDLGVVTSLFLPHSWQWTLMKERGQKEEKEMKEQRWGNWINA